MSWQPNPYSLLLVISALISSGSALYAWRRRPAPGATYLALVGAGAAIWSLGQAIGTGLPSLDARFFWAKVQYFGICLIPLSMFLFVLQYTGRVRWLTRRSRAILAVIPAATLLLVWTNGAHGLVWAGAEVVAVGSAYVLRLQYGPAFWLYAIYAYAVLLVSTALLVHATLSPSQLRRRQSAILLVGILLPWLGNLLYLIQWSPVSHFDWTPVLYSLSGLLMVWGLFRHRLLDLVPIAREKAFESIGDAVIVLDNQVRVIDLNPAALALINMPAASIIGQKLTQMLPIPADLLGLDKGSELPVAELELEQEGQQKTFSFRSSALTANHKEPKGQVLVMHDITESKRAADALRHSQRLLVEQNAELNKLTQAIRQSANTVIITNAEGAIEYANPKFTETTGFTLEEALGKTPRILRSGLHTPDFYEQLWSTILSGWEWRGEFRNRRKDGSLYWEQASIAPVTDAKGRMTHFVAVKEDISSRKEAEAVLMRQAERLQALSEMRQSILAASLPETVAIAAIRRVHKLIACQRIVALTVDVEGRLVLLASESSEQVASATEPEAYSELLDEDVLKSGWVKGVADLQAVSQPSILQETLLAAGIRSYVVAPMFFQGELVGTLNLESSAPQAFSNEDIAIATEVAASLALAIRQIQLFRQAQEELAERIEAERQLRARERFLALLNDITHTALQTDDLASLLDLSAERLAGVFQADGCYLSLWDEERQSPIPMAAYGEWHDYHAIQLEPHPRTITQRVLETGQPLVIENLARSGIIEEELAALSPSGSLLGLPLIAGGQKLGAAILAFTEPHQFSVDEIAWAEQAAAELALAVAKAHVVEALQASVSELRARNEELDAFAHTVAHDLKNPLSSLVAYADLLVEDYAASKDETLAESVPVIAESGRQMSTIIDELLLMSSVRNVDEIDALALEMGPIVEEALIRLRRPILETQARIIQPEAWPSSLGHAPWVVEVWVNYISNALKYGGQPPLVRLGTATQTELYQCSKSGPPPGANSPHPTNMVIFYVQDNGPGIPPEQQASLFTPFERLHQDRAEGHGLGLSIVQRIVHKLGGQTGLRSTDEGCTFYFCLPSDPNTKI